MEKQEQSTEAVICQADSADSSDAETLGNKAISSNFFSNHILKGVMMYKILCVVEFIVIAVLLIYIFNGKIDSAVDTNAISSNTGLTKSGSDSGNLNPKKGGALTGGRSRANIQRVVMQNIATLRYAYNRRLRDKPSLNGKITVKFAIDEYGEVMFASVVESTINDSELDSTVVDRVKSWNFGKINKPGDVTEVVYPFAFSQ